MSCESCPVLVFVHCIYLLCWCVCVQTRAYFRTFVWICLGSFWGTVGKCVGHVWDTFGTVVGHCGVVFGTLLGYVGTSFVKMSLQSKNKSFILLLIYIYILVDHEYGLQYVQIHKKRSRPFGLFLSSVMIYQSEGSERIMQVLGAMIVQEEVMTEIWFPRLSLSRGLAQAFFLFFKYFYRFCKQSSSTNRCLNGIRSGFGIASLRKKDDEDLVKKSRCVCHMILKVRRPRMRHHRVQNA